MAEIARMSEVDNNVQRCYDACMDRFSDHIAARKAPGERDSHLAARLGISRSHWRHIQAGRRKVTEAIAARAIAIWPDLEPIYLTEVQRKLHGNATSNGRTDHGPEVAA